MLRTLFALISFVACTTAWVLIQNFSHLASDVFWAHVGLTAACCFFFLISASIVTAGLIDKNSKLTAPRSLNSLFLLMLLIAQSGFAFGTIFNFEALLQLARAATVEEGNTIAIQEDGSAVLYGNIGPKTFQSLQTNLSNAPIHSLELLSGGGDIDSAEKIGDFIKKSGIQVSVRSHCASACVLIALSAPELYVSSEAQFGFHQASTAASPDSQLGSFYGKVATEEFVARLKTLGIPESLLHKARTTPPEQMHYISGKELARIGLARVHPPKHSD